MRKYFLIASSSLVVLIGLILIQLSFVGIKTNQFNNLIIEKVKSHNPNLNLDIKEINIKLKLSEKSIIVKTDEAKISIDDNLLELKEIIAQLDLVKIFKGENSIRNIILETNENPISNIIKFVNSYRFSIPRFIIFNQIEDGSLKARANIYFKKDNKDKILYEINGIVNNAKINFPKPKSIKNINFKFNIKNNKYVFDNTSFYYDGINFESEKININKVEKVFKVNGNLNTKEGLVNPIFISKLFDYNFDVVEDKDILVETKNEFTFLINSKRKLDNINFKSKLKFEEIFINKKYQNLIYLKDGIIKTEYSKNDLKINIDSKYLFLEDKNQNIKDNNILNINILKKNQNYDVNGTINNSERTFNPENLLKLANLKIDLLSNKKIKVQSNNSFKLKLDNNLKVKEYNLNSNLNFDKIFFDNSFQNLIYLKNGRIISNFSNKSYNLKIDTAYDFLNENYNNHEDNTLNLEITKDKDIKVKSLFKNNKTKINTSEFTKYFKDYESFIKNQDIIISSDSIVNFLIDKKNNIQDLNISSNLSFDKLNIDYISKKIKKRVPEYKNKIFLIGNNIIVNHTKDFSKILSSGKYALTDKTDHFDNFSFDILKENKITQFIANLEIKNNAFSINEIDYKKEKKIISNLMFDAVLKNNNMVNFKDINYSEGKNVILLKNLHLDKKLKVKNIDKIELNYLNNKNKKNIIKIAKNKSSKYILESKFFDGQPLIENILKGDSKNNFLKIFKNLNSKIDLKIDKFYLSDQSYLKKLNGEFSIESNQIKFGRIDAILDEKNKFSYNLKTTQKNEKITNIYIEKPKPFIKNYKFIKGFSGGKLYYDSVEKNGLTKSVLEISDFKVKKVPVLAKLLTLADIQGIADLLTGEGIRFNTFEMNYERSGSVTTINEIYAIGPAISMLMEGYLEKDKLTSLRGTLVPATTINKTISKIPLLGNILVGKKAGEGVFGVSFKIKGEPNNLKTTVNPVKTLTPRFITRTLKELKKN